MRTIIFATALCLSAVGLSAASNADAAIKRPTNISAQGLEPALKLLAKERGFQVVYRSEVVGDFQTSGAVGEFTADEALLQLLSGTGLIYRYLDENTVTIVPVQSTSKLLSAPFGDVGALEQNRESGDSLRVRENSLLDVFLLAQAADASSSQQLDSSGKDSGAGKEPERLEEIVVTAQRREEKLQDVPISISVLGGEDLDRSTASGITEALRTVPGVVTEVAFGGGTTITVRGVAPGAAQFFGSSPTAYYLDSVPFGLVKSAVLPDTNAYDLDRVEVLRGPQGTLYGANALNGVVRVLTHAPDLTEFDLKARSSLSSIEHGGTSSRIDAALNVPLVRDALAVRAVIGYQDAAGWIDQPGNPDVNDSQILTGRFRLAAQFSERLSLDLSAMVSDTEQSGPSFSVDGRTNNRAAVVNGIGGPEPQFTDYSSYGATVNYEFDNFTLTSATSFLDYRTQNKGNFPGTAFLLTDLEAEVFAQELNLISSGEGPWRWSLGAMYRDAEDNTYQEFGPFTPYVPIDYHQGSESIAVFGEVARDLTDTLELAVGLRYFEDKVSQHENQDFEINPPPFTGNPPMPGNGLYSNEVTFEKVSPRVTLTWQPTDNFTAYATYSEGFRSGADQNPNTLVAAPGLPPVEPDTLTNYEIGAKGNLGRGRISYDTALFYIDWQDIQTQFQVPYGNGTTTIAAPANAESASGLGFELSLVAQLTDRLRLGTTFAYNDVTFDSDVVTLGVVRFVEGSRVAGSAEYTAGAFADYSVPLGSSGYEGRFSASANYVSEKIESTVTSTISSDDILIGRLSFRVDAPSNWAATLFVDNLTDENGVYFASAISDDNGHPQPRTIGLQVEFRL